MPQISVLDIVVGAETTSFRPDNQSGNTTVFRSDAALPMLDRPTFSTSVRTAGTDKGKRIVGKFDWPILRNDVDGNPIRVAVPILEFNLRRPAALTDAEWTLVVDNFKAALDVAAIGEMITRSEAFY